MNRHDFDFILFRICHSSTLSHTQRESIILVVRGRPEYTVKTIKSPLRSIETQSTTVKVGSEIDKDILIFPDSQPSSR